MKSLDCFCLVILPLICVFWIEKCWSIDHESFDDNAEPFIVNGSPVKDGQMPHLFAIFRDRTEFICAGSFVGTRTGLSAAHCFYGSDQNPDRFTIHFNSVNLTNHRVLRSSVLPIVRITLHPAFNRNSLDNDLAMLTFAKSHRQVSNGQNSGTIEIEYEEPADNSEVVVSGWGATGPLESASVEQLLSARLTKMNQQICKERWIPSGNYYGRIRVTDQMFCAHSTKQSACNGDSGGPVTQNGKLIGVVSWGPDTCLNRLLPNVYVKLSRFQDWIDVNLV